MSKQLKSIADLPQDAIKEINLFLTFSPHSSFSDAEVALLNKKPNAYPLMRGTLLPDELMLEYGLIKGDFSEKFIADEIKQFKSTIVESDYSAEAYQEVINNELYRIKSQICRHAVVLFSNKPDVAELILLCDQYSPITIKKIKLIPDEDFSQSEVIKKRGETYTHVQGCLWVDKSLKGKFFGNIYALQTNGEFRKIAYSSIEQVRKLKGLKPLIKYTAMSKSLSYMLTTAQAYSFSESEIEYYSKMTQAELQHEFNCTQNAYENADDDCYLDHCHTLDLLQHVASLNKLKLN